MNPKPRTPAPPTPAPLGPEPLWRIVRGEHVLGSYRTEEMARIRWRALSQSIFGHGAKLIRPDGTVADE